MKLVAKFGFAKFPELNFETYFLSFPWEIVFGVISGNYLYLELEKNVKITVKYLKLFW